MVFAGILVILLAQTAALPVEQPSFDDFVAYFGKGYRDPTERARRRQIFDNNIKEIHRLNAQSVAQEGSGAAVFGVNKFSDMTPAEFKATHLLQNVELKRLLSTRNYVPANLSSGGPVATPAAHNWYLKATTPIKDSGSLGPDRGGGRIRT